MPAPKDEKKKDEWREKIRISKANNPKLYTRKESIDQDDIQSYHKKLIDASEVRYREAKIAGQVEDPYFLSFSRTTNLKQCYNLCSDEYIQMYKSQAGRCAICFEMLIRPNVDHNHETGKVRQLLCHTCNVGLANFKEDSVRLMEAALYLKRWANKY